MVSTSTAALNGVEGKMNIEVQIDGNKVFVELMDDGFFGSESEKMTQCYVEILERLNDEESFMANVYSKDENGKWTMSQEESVGGMDNSDILDEYVEMYDFENYTYNATLRQYEAKYLEFDLGEESGRNLIIDFMAFQFENGKLIHEEAQYETELGDVSYSVVSSMTYSYGTASVTLPVVGD